METNSGVWLDRTLRSSVCGIWWSASASGGHPLALLQLDPTLAAQPAVLERVAAAVAALREVNPVGVLRTTELVVDARRAWLVVATLPTPTLADLIATVTSAGAVSSAGARGPDEPPPVALAPGAGAGIAVDVAQALRGLHANGLSHGDLTAENVVLTSAGTAVLIETGVLAAVRDEPTDAGRDAAAWAALVRDLARAVAEPEAGQLSAAAATAESGDLATAARQLEAQAASLPDFADRESLAGALPSLSTDLAKIPAQRSTVDESRIGPQYGPIRLRFGRGVPDSAIVAVRAIEAAAAARAPRRSPRAIQLAVLVVLLLLGVGAGLWWLLIF